MKRFSRLAQEGRSRPDWIKPIDQDQHQRLVGHQRRQKDKDPGKRPNLLAASKEQRTKKGHRQHGNRATQESNDTNALAAQGRLLEGFRPNFSHMSAVATLMPKPLKPSAYMTRSDSLVRNKTPAPQSVLAPGLFASQSQHDSARLGRFSRP